jgi:hypothetical protein
MTDRRLEVIVDGIVWLLLDTRVTDKSLLL